MRTKEGRIIGLPFEDGCLSVSQWSWEELLQFCQVRHDYRPVDIMRYPGILKITVELVE